MMALTTSPTTQPTSPIISKVPTMLVISDKPGRLDVFGLIGGSVGEVAARKYVEAW